MPEAIKIIRNNSRNPIKNRIMIGTPTLGIVRLEWAQARYSQGIPTNWVASNVSLGYVHAAPLGYLVADAQNVIVDVALRDNFEWVLLLEDDVLPPPDAFLRLNEYMKKGDIPVVSGLYYLKTSPTEPLIYRGRGNGPYTDFKLGDLVWADGVPTGFLLINSKILRLMAEESEYYMTGTNQKLKKVFETPSKAWFDPETCQLRLSGGTSDLTWCDRIMKEDVLSRDGWKKIGKKVNPFLVDTNIFCTHIDLTTGIQYPQAIPKENQRNNGGK
jgi:hypothetical protein